MPANPSDSRKKDTVSFRLPEPFILQLAAQAKEQKKKSADELARDIVIRSLTDTGESESQRRIAALSDQVRTLREDLITVVAFMVRVLDEDVDARDARRKAEEIFRELR